MKVKSESEIAQSCPTLQDPMDCSLSGFSSTNKNETHQVHLVNWEDREQKASAPRRSKTP